MTDYIYGLLFTYLAFIFAVLSPGPNIFGILNITLEKGRSAGFLFGFGIALGSLTWASLSVLGLTQLIAQFGYLLFIVKILGGGYLLYLAYMAFNSSKQNLLGSLNSNNTDRPKKYLLRGYLLMMTNPKAAMAWIALVSLSTFSGAPLWVPLAAVLGTFLLSIVIHTTLACVFSNNSFLTYYSKARSRILKAFAIVYGGLGIKLLTSAD